MKPTTAYKMLFIISGMMFIVAAGEIAFALFADEGLSALPYTMFFQTIVNAALFFIVGLNIKTKVEKEEGRR